MVAAVAGTAFDVILAEGFEAAALPRFALAPFVTVFLSATEMLLSLMLQCNIAARLADFKSFLCSAASNGKACFFSVEESANPP